MEYVYLDIFSQSRRPFFHIARDDEFLKSNRFWCDRFITVFRNWDTSRGGSFFPEPLGLDMIRAAAYRRAGVSLKMKSANDLLALVQIQRLTKRKILNEMELFSAIQNRYKDSVGFLNSL